MTHHTPHHPRSPRNSRTALALVAALALCVGAAPRAAFALERAPTPMSELLKAPYQLEVTTLSVETKQGPHSGVSIWCRVRVDRVMAGAGLKPGDEVAVVSVRYDNPPGTVGASGHWNIPAVGERRRVFASGDAQTLQPLPPNGWHPVRREVAIVAAQSSTSSPNAAPRKGPWAEFAASLKVAGIANTTVSAELFILATPLTGDALDQRDLALAGRVPLVITGPAVLGLAGPQAPAATTPSTPSTPQFPLSRREGETSLAALPAAAGISPPAAPGTRFELSTHTRILPPDAAAATHPLLAGINIPPEGLVVASPLAKTPLPPLLPNATVLLWGEPANADGSRATSASAADATTPTPGSGGAAGSSSRQPVLWVTSQPRTSTLAPTGNGNARIELPPRRIVATTLGEAGLSHATVRLILEWSIGWALDLPDGPERGSSSTMPQPSSAPR